MTLFALSQITLHHLGLLVKVHLQRDDVLLLLLHLLLVLLRVGGTSELVEVSADRPNVARDQFRNLKEIGYVI